MLASPVFGGDAKSNSLPPQPPGQSNPSQKQRGARKQLWGPTLSLTLDPGALKAKFQSTFKIAYGREVCPFLHTLSPTQTTGSPFKLLQQRLLSGTPPNTPSPRTRFLPVSKPQSPRPPIPLRDHPSLLSRLQLAFFSLPLPSLDYFQEPMG